MPRMAEARYPKKLVGSQRQDQFMTLAWHFKKFDWRKWRKRVPAKKISEWGEWLERRPQGQHQSDKMLAHAISMLAASLGHELTADQILSAFYEIPAPEVKELSQGEIDFHVQVAKARQPSPEKHAAAMSQDNACPASAT